MHSVCTAGPITVRVFLSFSRLDHRHGLDLRIPLSGVTYFPGCSSCCKLKKKKKAKKPQPFIHRPGTTPLPAALPKPLVRITASGQRGGRASQPAARVCREFLQILRCGPLPPRPISAQTSVRAPAGGTVGLAPCLGLEFQHRLKRQGPCPRGTDIGEGGKHQSNEVTV